MDAFSGFAEMLFALLLGVFVIGGILFLGVFLIARWLF